MSLQTTLYPPIISTYMPAFICEGSNSKSCFVDFTIPDANDISDIKYVQVSIRSQATNLSALDANKYPCEIMLTSLRYSEESNKYFIEIPSSAMSNEQFEMNVYYKVQLRFVSEEAADIDYGLPQSIAGWLIENLSYFSEWSTVTLVRGISEPTLYLFGYNAAGIAVSFGKTSSTLVGKLLFSNELDNESLAAYRIKIYEEGSSTAIIDSGLLYSDTFTDSNTFQFQLNYELDFGAPYVLRVEYQTNNQYSSQVDLEFTSEPSEGEVENITLGVLEEKYAGRMKVNLRRLTNLPLTGSIYIKRTSSLSDFKVWEDWKTINCTGVTDLRETFYDNTVESGVWYRYGVQVKTNSSGGFTEIKYSKTPKMIMLEDMFLTANDKQLNVKFNPTISNFKRTVTEVKVDTIGNPYPFIKRSGAVNYITFPIGGLISTAIDENEYFTSKDEIYGKQSYLYEKYNLENNINSYNDYFLENAFKHKVMDFLNSGDTFLFRSSTEGSYLIKILSGVTLTPNTVLGRRLWTFAGTAYEIAELSLANMNEAGVYSSIENRYGEGYEPEVDPGLDPADIKIIYTSTASSPDEELSFDSWGELRETIMTNTDIWTGRMKLVYNGTSEIDTEGLFEECKGLTEIDLSEIDSSKIKSVENMFLNCTGLQTVDLTNFKINNATTVASMFEGCSSLTEITNLADLSLENVLTMNRMFWGCSSLKSIDLSGMFTTRNTNLAGLFGECISLQACEFGDFYTNSVTTYAGMFYDCMSLEKLNLTDIDTSAAKDYSTTNMFYNCIALENLILLKPTIVFNEDTLSDIKLPFNSNLKILVPKGLLDNYGIHPLWKKYFDYMEVEKPVINITFETEDEGLQYEEFETFLELSSFLAANKTSFINHLKVVYQGDADASPDGFELFRYCSASTIDLSEFDVQEFTDARYILASCSNLVSVNINNWNTSKITSLEGMFRYNSNLSYITSSTTLDLTNLVSTMHMFRDCSSLVYVDMSKWVTSSKLSQVTYMFTGSLVNTLYMTGRTVLEFPNSSIGLTYYSGSDLVLRIVVDDDMVDDYLASTPWGDSYPDAIIGLSDFSSTTPYLLALGVQPAETEEEQIEQLLEMGVVVNDDI